MQKEFNTKHIILSLLGGFGGTYGISYLSKLFTNTAFSNSILSVGVFAVLAFILYLTFKDIDQLSDRKSKIHRITFAFAVAFIFALSLILGYQLRYTGMTECGFKGKGLIAARSILLAFSILPFSNMLFKWGELLASAKKTENSMAWNCTKLFFISWGIIFLCLIPVFLAYYPAIMSYDFHRQSCEALQGFAWFNAYQPLAHTWLIWVAFQIGHAVDSLEIGMACYSIFQMLLFSAACGYSCNVVYRLTRRKWPVIILIAFYGLFPYNSVLALSVTKDIPFSALFLVFVCLFVERTFLTTGKKQKNIDILWVLEGIIMMLFRNNALYAVAVFAIVLLIFNSTKQRVWILVMSLCLILGGKGALEGIQLAIGTELGGSPAEMFNVPIQQFARVGYYHGDNLDEETYALLDKYMPEEYWDAYNPPLADTVKLSFSTPFNTNWYNHYPDVFKAWLQIGLKYPNEYIDAFLILTSGYWFIDDVSFAEVLGYGPESRMGALYTHNSTVSDFLPEGIAHESNLPWLEDMLENIVSANCFYNWPVINCLFKPAFYCWALLLTAILCLYSRSKKKLLVTLLPLIYIATMFLGPVVLVRYVWPIMLTLPVMIGVLVTEEK